MNKQLLNDLTYADLGGKRREVHLGNAQGGELLGHHVDGEVVAGVERRRGDQGHDADDAFREPAAFVLQMGKHQFVKIEVTAS